MSLCLNAVLCSLVLHSILLCEGRESSKYLRYNSDLQPKYHHSNNSVVGGKAGVVGALHWLQSAQDMFSSPAGHVMVQVAKELLNRSTGNSQVVSTVH